MKPVAVLEITDPPAPAATFDDGDPHLAAAPQAPPRVRILSRWRVNPSDAIALLAGAELEVSIEGRTATLRVRRR